MSFWNLGYRTKLRAEAFTSLQQYHLQINIIISPAKDASKQTVNRDILVMAFQSFSVNNCVCVIPKENSLNHNSSFLR